MGGRLEICLNGFCLYVLSAPKFLIDHLGVSARLAGQVSSRRTIGLGFAIMIVAAFGNVLLNLWLPPKLPWAVL